MTEGGAELDARVFAECWMPFGGNQQICAEGIEITAGASQFEEVTRFLVPLIVPDLPVVLWCRGNRWFAPGRFDALFSLAGKIIFDSSSAPDALAAIGMLKELRARTQARIADLAWARLTGSRQVLANVFDDHLMSAAAVSAVRIEYGSPEAPESGILHFKTWIERCLPAAVVTLDRISGSTGLQRVTLTGSGNEIEVVWEEPSAIEIRAGNRRCRSMLPSASDDAAMREELSIPGDDPVFEKVLAG
jgi:glucose-6-phosphate dehydrogenase assembly protein OpcA